MKSFLKEIENKFVELEEQKTPLEADELTNALKKLKQAQAGYNAELSKTAELTPEGYTNDANEDGISDADGMPLDEEHNCKRDHPGMSHKEFELKELGEMSTTAAVAPVTGKYFMKKKKNETTYKTVQEAMDSKYERLIESYTKFSRGDRNTTPEQKVSRTIQKVSKKLREIEILVNHTTKLKTESGMSRDNYGPRTEKALNKISQKLIKIAERIRALGE